MPANLNTLFTVALMFIICIMVLHGLIGPYLKPGSFYCSMRAVILQVTCPPHAGDTSQSKYIENLLLSNSGDQSLFHAAASFLVFLVIIFLYTAVVVPIATALVVPSHRHSDPGPRESIFFIKLRRWSRQLIQSPTYVGA